MITILRKEISEFFGSLTGYLSIMIFLLIVSLIMWIFPDSNVLDYGYASLEPIFSLGPYVFLFLVPAITMRSFAEEKRNGTLELLLTFPINSWSIVIGKWLGAVVIVLFSLIPTLLYYYTIYIFGNPIGNLDTSGIVGSYIGLFLLGASFAGIGIFCSMITTNQVISFVIAAIASFVFFEGLAIFSQIDLWSDFGAFLERMGMLYHYNSMSRGLLELTDITYFVGFIFITLLGSWMVLEIRK